MKIKKVNVEKVKEFILKFIVLGLSFTGIISISYFLDVVSEGNLLGIGMGTYLMSLIGLLTLFSKLHKIVFKEKKDGECEQNRV